MRVIDADKLIELIDDDIATLNFIDMPREGHDVCLCTLQMVTQYIKALPTIEAVPLEDYRSMEQTVHKLTQALAEAEPIKHGRWIKRGDNSWECSVCHEISCCNGNYCVDCGAKMDGAEND